MLNPEKILVIGGNAAGPAAAAKAKRVNPNAEIILIEAGNFISTGTCELPYLISGEIPDYNKIVFFTPEKFEESKGVKVLVNHLVKKVDPKYKEIELVNRLDNTTRELEYDKLILTTGSKPREIPDLSSNLENVFTFKSVHDYLNIKQYMENNDVEKILIIGSGYIGLEIADALSFSNYKITLLEKENLPIPSLDNEVRHLIKGVIDSSDMNFFIYEDSTRFIIKENKMFQLVHEGRFLEYDMVIVSAGVVPNNYLADDAGLKLGAKGGLLIDNRLRTSDPNIYAAGDNIEIKNRITNKFDYFPLATHAHQYGHIAGENAAGGNKIAEPIILNTAFKFRGKYIARVGLSQAEAEENFVNAKFVTAITDNKVKVMPNSEKVFGKIIFDKDNKLILGASFMGGEEISGYADIVSSFIYNKLNATALSKINFNYTPPLSPFINLLSILGRKILEFK